MAIRQAGEVGRLPSSMASDLLDSLPVAVGCVDAEECVVFVNRAFSAAVAVAAGAQLRGAPDPLGRLGACARQVITTGAPSELTVAGTPGWARVFPVGAEHAGVVLAGPVSAAARSAEEQAALRRVAMLVAKDAAPEAVFAVASEQVGRLLGAEVGAVLRFVGAERAIVAGVWREDGIRGFPVNAELDFERTNSDIGRAHATRREFSPQAREGLARLLLCRRRALFEESGDLESEIRHQTRAAAPSSRSFCRTPNTRSRDAGVIGTIGSRSSSSHRPIAAMAALHGAGLLSTKLPVSSGSSQP